MQLNPTPDVKIWAISVTVPKMCQAMSKPGVAQQPQLHTEVTHQYTPHSRPCTSVSSQQGSWGSQSTPEPNLRWASWPKEKCQKFLLTWTTHNPSSSCKIYLTTPCVHRWQAWNPSVNFSQGNMESGLTLTAWTIYLALSWWDRYGDSWPKLFCIMLFQWKPVLDTKIHKPMSYLYL